MQEVTFTLRTLTPLFLAGADQQEVPVPTRYQLPKQATDAWEFLPEIRPPSFRGLMRYWLRAAVAGLAPTEMVSLETVRAFEKSIFGATNHGSVVQIRVTHISGDKKRFKKESHSRFDVSGEDYLYFSMANSRKGDDYKPERWYFLPDTNFRVTLAVHDRGEETPSQKLECAVAAFWLLLSLGGIGSRSRRCAGSLTVADVCGNTTGLSFAEARTAEDLQQNLRQGMQVVRQLYTRHLAAVKTSLDTSVSPPLEEASFDTLALPNSCRIWILRPKDSFVWLRLKDALDDIGKELQTCRDSIPLAQRTTLGLPLIVQGMQPSPLKKALEKNRRASPLLLTIKKLQGEKYVGIAVLFKTQTHSIQHLPAPDYTLIEQWIDKKLSHTTALKVIL